MDRVAGRPVPTGDRLRTDQAGAPDEPDPGLALAAAQQGDTEAFRVLYRDIQPRLVRYLRALVGEDAEDVTSETWLQVARDLGGFQGTYDGFRGWVVTVGRHRALDHLRREGRRPPAVLVPAEDLAALAGADDTAAGALEAVSTDGAIRLIASLPRDLLAKLPASVLATLPPSVLAKLPSSVLARLPLSALDKLPPSVLAKLPTSVLAKLPSSVLARLPASVLASLPPAIRAELPAALQARLPLG
jgi:RNA polymerase sigma-70 factor, ECF subfamily